MKRSLKPCLLVLALAAAWSVGAPQGSADPGLLLIAHGSPSRQWNEPVLELGRRVAAEAQKQGRFRAVRTAMLEAAQPDVATAVAELEREGCDRIVAVPLFIAPSGHSHFDVPAVLGIYSSPTTVAALAEEGAVAARPSVPVTLTQTLSEGRLLATYTLDEVRKLSTSPGDEALVLLAHGDSDHGPLVDRLMRQIATYCCGQAGISYGDWAYVAVGQEYLSRGVPVIQNALKHRKRVLVVGVYLSLTASRLHERRARTAQHGRAESDLLASRDVAFSETAVVDHPELVPWILDAAGAALGPVGDGRPVAAARTSDHPVR